KKLGLISILSNPKKATSSLDESALVHSQHSRSLQISSKENFQFNSSLPTQNARNTGDPSGYGYPYPMLAFPTNNQPPWGLSQPHQPQPPPQPQQLGGGGGASGATLQQQQQQHQNTNNAGPNNGSHPH